MSIFSDIEEAVFFDEADMRLIFTMTWNDIEEGIKSRKNYSMCLQDMMDGIQSNAFKIIGDAAYDRARI